METAKINVGLSDEQLDAVVQTLNTLLADQILLYQKTRNYHWNVVGPRFNDLHKFFEEQYTQLEEMIDETAENARQFGGVALGTLAQVIELSRLQETPGRIPEENGMLSDLLNDHETVIRSLREDIEKAEDELKAAEAADELTAQLELHSKMAWMLRSMLGGHPRKFEVKPRQTQELAGSRS